MERLLNYATDFIKQSDWRDLTLLKFCLYTLGILCGMRISEKARKPVAAISVSIFIATYIPLVLKLLKIMGIIPTKKHVLIENDEDILGV